MKMTAAHFKARCLKLMDRVEKTKEEIVITKYGKPVAKLVSLSEIKKKNIFGFLKDTVKIHQDIINA